MILTVFRPKRIKSGKVQIARSYRGRYRLDGEKKITDIPLHTTDKRVAQQRIEQIVKEKQMEAVGLLASHATRAASQTRLEKHLSDYVADLQAVGRDGQYIYELGNRVRRLMRECAWSQIKGRYLGFFSGMAGQAVSRPQDRERIPHFHNVASQLDGEARAH